MFLLFLFVVGALNLSLEANTGICLIDLSSVASHRPAWRQIMMSDSVRNKLHPVSLHDDWCFKVDINTLSITWLRTDSSAILNGVTRQIKAIRSYCEPKKVLKETKQMNSVGDTVPADSFKLYLGISKRGDIQYTPEYASWRHGHWW